MRVRFDDLPKVVRERLVEITNAPGDPRVLTVQRHMRGGWFKYFILVASSLVLTFCLNYIFRAAPLVHPRHNQEAYAGMAAALWLLGVAAAAIAFKKRWPPAPYKGGLYAFPTCLARLTRGWVDLMPISTLPKPTIVTVLRNGAYQGSRLVFTPTFTFYFGTKQAVEEACARILAAKEKIGPLVAARNRDALLQLDPFAECTLSGNWKYDEQSEGPISPLVPGSALLIQWFGALLAALLLSGALYQYTIVAFEPDRQARGW